MCTALTYTAGEHYFGRNLDLDRSWGETVTVTPRNFPLSFRRVGTLKNHYALIGMALVAEGYPLYYDAVNEKGLSMAGLNFPSAPFISRSGRAGTISPPSSSSPGSWGSAPIWPRPGGCWRASIWRISLSAKNCPRRRSTGLSPTSAPLLRRNRWRRGCSSMKIPWAC